MLRQTCIEGLTLVVEVLLVLVLGIFMGADLNSALLVYPLIFIGILALGLGASLIMCGLVVFLSDLNYVWGLFCRLLFFVTPVFFSPQVVGEGVARTVIELNPLSKLLMLARETLLYGGPIDPAQVALALVGPLVVLILGGVLFNAVKPKIPDYI